MEDKILRGIKDVGYTGALQEQTVFAESIEEGAKNVEYTRLVHFLTNELRSLCNIDEEVNYITAPEDSVAFMMELSSFLKELGCPHDCLTQGHISDRLATKEDKLLLLDYLMTEMMAARVLQEKKPDKKIELKLKESRQAANLKKMLVILRFPKPPSNITVQTLFQKLNPTVQTLVQKAGDELLGTPICNFAINDKQWDTLGKVQTDLHAEYKIRREMMLKRLDCTIQSFQWSDKMKGKDELIAKSYSEKRKLLKVEPDVDISDLLSAREDLAIIEKTSSANVRKNTQSSINKVIIGQVPDRGGRTSEQAPPPPEMPSWQQRQPGPSGGGRGGQRGRGDFNNRGGHGARGGFDSAGSYGGGGNTYNKTGDTSRGRGNYQQGNNYNKSSDYQQDTYDNRSQTGGSYDNRSQSGGSYDNRSQSRGSYDNRSQSGYQQAGGYDTNRSNYQQTTGGYDSNRSQNNRQQSGGSYDNNRPQSNYQAGGYENKTGNYSRGGSSGSRGNSVNLRYDSAGSYSSGYAGGGYSQNFDSAGPYGGPKTRGSQDYENEPKRPKTFDSFQTNKTTYADQYVQESQNNQHYQPRGHRGGGRGRSNYSRGGQQNYY